MVSLGALWVPILVSAVLVFVVSSLLHMVLTYHRSDYLKFSNEDEVRSAIKRGSPAPGQYLLLHAMGPDSLKDPSMIEKFKQGPSGLVFVRKPGMPTMGPLLAQWFIYQIVVSLFAGYVASAVLPPGTAYLKVFQVVGTVAFVAYAAARTQSAIWQGEPWSVAIKEMIDGLIYGLLTAGVFGWLWPKA
jgi:Flp pilus assembly protein TadB